MSYKNILNLADHLVVSPGTIHQSALDVFDAALNGEVDLVDPTNCFMMLMEASATEAAMATLRGERLARRAYPVLAQTMSDLFGHVSQYDNAGIYASPLTNFPIKLGLASQQIRQYAVIDPASGLPRMTIPRDTLFTAAGFSFYLHYPINIVVMPSGDLEVYYDVSNASPIRRLETNAIKKRFTRIDDVEYLELELLTDQLHVSTQSQPVTASTGFSMEIQFEDQFYFARVFTTTNNLTWTEAAITYDDQTYDPNKTTAVLQVDGQILRLRIPDVYLSKSMAGNMARVDLYTTKGKTSINLADVPATQWQVEWNDYSNLASGFVSPLTNVSAMYAYSTGTYAGGSNAISFEELRDRVNYNLHGKPLPVTREELSAHLRTYGFGSSRQKDNISDRTYVATSDVPTPASNNLSSSIPVVNERVWYNTTRTDLGKYMVANKDQVTIRPGLLYVNELGNMRIVTDAERVALEGLSRPALADELNNNSYFFTPYHYVLDYRTSAFMVRPYYLGNPVVDGRSYLGNNPALGFTVSTEKVSFSQNDNSCSVHVVTKTPTNQLGLMAQLVMTLNNGTRLALQSAQTVVSSTESEFAFTFNHNLDIDENDALLVSNWLDGAGTVVESRLPLAGTLDLIYLLATPTVEASSFDNRFLPGITGTVVSGLVYESISYTLGKQMQHLYTHPRSVIQPSRYRLHTVDVPKVYDEDQYETDGIGSVYTVNADGSYEFVIKHKAGEQVVIDGVPQWLARAGSLYHDGAGNPELLEPAVTVREFNTLLLDARYFYANTPWVTEYTASMPRELADTITVNLPRLADGMWERTELFYEPRATASTARLGLENGRETVASTSVPIRISIEVDDATYKDNDVRLVISKGVRSVVAAEMRKRTFSITKLVKAIDNLAPENIRAVHIENPFPGNSTATLLDDNATFAIATKLRLLANGQLDIVDDLDIQFTQPKIA